MVGSPCRCLDVGGARLVIVVSTGVDDEGDRCDQDTAAVQGTESAQ